MSLVGTRPILQDELRQYELHHRAPNGFEKKVKMIYVFIVLSKQEEIKQ